MSDPASRLPKYLQIAEMLIRDVASGRLIDGEKLPPERQMAASLGIAVGTLRKALVDLEDKGVLERRQGSGNYVRQTADAAGIYALFRLERIEGGGLPTAQVLGTRRMAKPQDLPAFGVSRDAHRIRRLRFLSSVPAAMEEIWLDGRWAETVRPEDVSDSLYYYYQRKLGLFISKVEDRVGVSALPTWSEPAIGLEPGQTVGFVERWTQSTDGEVIEYSRTWFNHHRARYVSRFR